MLDKLQCYCYFLLPLPLGVLFFLVRPLEALASVPTQNDTVSPCPWLLQVPICLGYVSCLDFLAGLSPVVNGRTLKVTKDKTRIPRYVTTSNSRVTNSLLSSTL